MNRTYQQGHIIILDKTVGKGPWVPAITSTKEPKWGWINIDNEEHARAQTLQSQDGKYVAIFATEGDAEKFRLVYPELCKTSSIVNVDLFV